ncbi:efflux RND transporter periplasmic adaptor subunit [Patescibacteria group bacterium]|nr:efflux RND transporter periplasmic adaptor subunit [Patescibacteria group bacterium]
MKYLKSLRAWFVKASLLVKIISVALVIIILLFIGSRLNPFAKKQAAYQTSQVEKGTIVSSLSESGQVLSANFVNVFTQASGQISKINVKDGDEVKKGDIIAEIDLDQLGAQRNTQAYASYLSAKSSLNNAQAQEYSLQSTMFNKWNTFFNLATNSTYQNSDGSPNESNRALPEFHIAQDDWLASEANYKNQENVVNQASANLQNAWVTYQLTSSQITAPMDGTITNLTIFPGITISNTSSTTNSSNSNISSQQIAVIQNEQNPLATFNVSEVDINKIKLGQKATLTLDSIPDKTFTGKIVTVDRIGSVTSSVTNYPVIIQFDTTVPEVLPNMAINADIIVATKDNVLLVPSTAVQTVNNQTVVRVLQKGQLQQVAVGTGLTSDTQTEITSGLTEGQTIVTSIISNGTTTQSSQSPFSSFGNRGFGGAVRVGR